MSYAMEAAVMPSTQETVTDTSSDEAYRAELERVCGIIKDYIQMKKLTKLDCYVHFGDTEEFRYIEIYGGAYYGDAEAESQMQDVKKYCESEGFTNRYNFRFALPVPMPEGEPGPSVPDDHTQRIFVVDDATSELIHMEDGQTYSVSFHSGVAVEFAMTDGTFAWGTMWGPTTEWDYNAQNPYIIDISDFSGGFGIDGYEVVDIDLPEGYYLPDDYLEAIEYENDATDIYIRLKKTLPGDVNGDGVFSAADLILLQKWLLNVPDTKLADWRAADFCEDGVLDVFDLSMMKKALISQNKNVAKEAVDYTVLGESWTSLRNNDGFYGEIGAATTYSEMCEIFEKTTDYTTVDGLQIEELNASFFDDHIVVVLYSSCGASNRKITIDKIEKEQNCLKVYTTTNFPAFPTPDMRAFRMILAIDRADFEGIEEVLQVDDLVMEEYQQEESLEYTVIDKGSSSVTSENHDGYVSIAYTKEELFETIRRVEELTYTDRLSETIDGYYKKLSDDQAVIVVYSGAKAGSSKFILDDVVREQNEIKVYSRILIDKYPTPDYVSDVILLAVNRADIQGVSGITQVNTRIQEE